ncbi:hypothetical protein ACQWU4_01185 [Chryseobacterium sp. MIQD13]|uniref:hypothetical protein n=1 Tax=Chryseobacterium sp. MIQD13 TaxID=3422310 RepID=UPI003D2B3A12
MLNIIKIVIVTFLVTPVIYLAQGLTQSADGKSTIPLKGFGVGIDIAKAELAFGANNIDKTVTAKKIKPIFGIDIKVKNEEGIGNLFSSGGLVPSGSASLYGGITFSNAFNTAEVAELERRAKLVKDFSKTRDDLRKAMKTDFAAKIKTVSAQISNTAKRELFEQSLNTKLNSLTEVEEFYDEVISREASDMEMELAYAELASYTRERKEDLISKKKANNKKLEALHDEFKTGSFQRFTVFGFGGISALGFKMFKAVDSTNLANSFENINDRGGNIGIGINYQNRNVWVGVTYSYTSTNNFEVLDKKEYTLRKTTNIGGQSLGEESKITGYGGTYGEVEVNNLNADLVWRIKLEKENSYHLLLNPYLRARLFSRDTSLLFNKTNIGSGFYFLKGKFLGGFYVELPDINNNEERMKPELDQNLRPPLERITFGIVTKMNLGTIMGW